MPEALNVNAQRYLKVRNKKSGVFRFYLNMVAEIIITFIF